MYRTRFFKFFAAAMLASFAIAARADQILDWNATIRQTIQTNTSQANPGWSTRSMALSNGAMYDVMMAFAPTYAPYKYQGSAPVGASQEAAIAQAAYDTMVYSYQNEPNYLTTLKPILDARLNLDLNAIPNSPAKTAGINFGSQVATAYTNWRTNDGASGSTPYVVNPAMGHWSPDPMNPTQQAWGPAWGTVKTFTIQSSAQFPVSGAPAMTDAEYTANYNEVKDYGALVSPSRTADQTNIGLFWAYDRPTMGPPPVLYSKNVADIARQNGNTQEQNARLFAMMSVALADASIAAWDVKFNPAHDIWRPITAIRNGDADGNPLTAGDPNWVPLGAPGANPAISTDDFTPPFPAYVSGHATFGGAVYQVLRRFYGSDAPTLINDESANAMDIFRLYSDEALINGDPNYRDFSSFTEAEWENAISRVYLGVHWRFDVEDGVLLGNNIGNYVFDNFQAVPEPSTIALGAAALTGIGYAARRRKKAAA